MPQPYDLPINELRKYKPELTKQEDFDQFWEDTLSELKKVPLKYDLEPYDYPVEGVKVYRISYKGFLNADIEGWFAIPREERKYPGLLMFHGYNWAYDGNIHEVVNWALRGYAALQILTRGQQGGSVDNAVPSGGFAAGWMTKGIMSPEEYYYRGVYMDCVRATEVLAAMDSVDETRIGLTGGSQGGALAMATAALSDIPKVVVSDYPYLSNFERAIDIVPQGPYLEINEYFRRYSDPSVEEKAKKTLSYFDIMNLAPKIKCKTLIFIGLIDEITPPSTVFGAYNHLKCEKEIQTFRYFGHEYIPGSVEPKLRTLKSILQDSIT